VVQLQGKVKLSFEDTICGRRRMARPRARVTIVIQENGKLFECRTSLRIGAAEENIRKDYHLQDGSIKLNDDSLDPSRTFAEEIEDIIGEGIQTLQFDGEKIINSEGNEFIFTFVNGENELSFHDFIHYFFRYFNPINFIR
jgi:hypothetical protein